MGKKLWKGRAEKVRRRCISAFSGKKKNSLLTQGGRGDVNSLWKEEKEAEEEASPLLLLPLLFGKKEETDRHAHKAF